MLKQELLNHAEQLRKDSNELRILIESFEAAGFKWEEVTELQLQILLELKPLKYFTPSQELLTLLKGELLERISNASQR